MTRTRHAWLPLPDIPAALAAGAVLVYRTGPARVPCRGEGAVVVWRRA